MSARFTPCFLAASLVLCGFFGAFAQGGGKPSDPGKPGDPGKPSDPGKPGDPGKPKGPWEARRAGRTVGPGKRDCRDSVAGGPLRNNPYMRPLSLSAVLLVCAAVPSPSQTAVSVSAQTGNFHLAVSSFFGVPNREVVVIRDAGFPTMRFHLPCSSPSRLAYLPPRSSSFGRAANRGGTSRCTWGSARRSITFP